MSFKLLGYTCREELTVNVVQVFESLKKHVDPRVQEERERAVNERVRLQYEKAQARLAELVS